MAKYYMNGYTPPEGVNSASKVKEYQRQLGVKADGIWGPDTDAAYRASLNRSAQRQAQSRSGFDWGDSGRNEAFDGYYNAIRNSLSVPTVTVKAPSAGEVKDMWSGVLRPSADAAIERRNRAAEREMAEIDADAVSRGMGQSSYVTSVKARQMEEAQDDISDIEAQYGAAALAALADKYTASGKAATDTSVNVTTSDIEGGAKMVSDYVTKKAAADALYETYIKDAREKANEAYTSLEAGTSFQDVLQKYGEDTMYTQYPSFVDTGLLMYVGGVDTTWNEELVKAVGLLKNGEHTGVILADDVFYILQLVGSEPAGEKTLTDAHDDIKAAVVAKNSDALWGTQLETWQNDTKIVKYFEDVYRSIGK